MKHSVFVLAAILLFSPVVFGGELVIYPAQQQTAENG